MFGDAKAAIAGIVGAVFGLMLGVVVMAGYGSWVAIPAAERAASAAATTAADARWEIQMAAARRLAEQDAAKAQAAINAVEAEYYERDKARQEAMASLEAALQEEEKANVPTPSAAARSAAPSTGRSAPSVCRPAISRGVRDALQRIGRASASPNPAKPDATLRPGR